MKKIVVFILAICCFAISYPQTILKFEDHALKPGMHNPMSYCSFIDPGIAGSDVTWDFSELRFIKSFEGYINKSQDTEFGKFFAESNTELAEFNSRFYFKVSEDKMEQYGYSTDDGKHQVHFSVPFVKIKFPFVFKDVFSGSVEGTASYNGIINSTIGGSYFVEADAYGTLILPGNTMYENTLRIRTEKEYTTHYSNLDQEVYIITYRWYNSAHRYPLLVLTTYTTKTKNSESIHHQAAYNVNALKSVEQFYEEDVEIYPNPASKTLNVRLNALSEGNYYFEIFNTSGEFIHSFYRETSAVGLHDFDLSGVITGLKPANYVLVISNANTSVSKNFVLAE